jgi:hypothetical protein
MLILGAEPSIISRFQPLNLIDVVRSSAVLDPNEPGSTSIKLSWIWQTSTRHLIGFADANDEVDTYAGQRAETPANLLECVFISLSVDGIHFYLVWRIHWLRARAQLMRWQEEVTLTTYEMQWTVRYFIYKSQKWSMIVDDDIKQLESSAGALAYARRKESKWLLLSWKSDRSFKIINNAYKSPL